MRKIRTETYGKTLKDRLELRMQTKISLDNKVSSDHSILQFGQTVLIFVDGADKKATGSLIFEEDNKLNVHAYRVNIQEIKLHRV